MNCVICGRDLRRKPTGRPRKTCSGRCRVALSRRRKAQPLGRFHSEPRWVRAAGKRPVMPDGMPASSTDSDTWSLFADVLAGAGDGFGVMLGGGLGCYDLDDAVDDSGVKSWAREFIAAIPEPVVFTELSVSGAGVHVFVEAPEGKGTRCVVGDGHVERYTRARFIRMGEPLNL